MILNIQKHKETVTEAAPPVSFVLATQVASRHNNLYCPVQLQVRMSEKDF